MGFPKLNWKNQKAKGPKNHMKKTRTKLFNSHEECFIKFGKVYYKNLKT